MHIPDGFLNGATIATTTAVSAGGLGAAIRITGNKLADRKVPLMGMTAAFIFAVQMLNFPVAAGTSGHVLGAAMAAILLGPWSAVIIMSLVLVAQCLIFQDGGLLALGANIFNMAIVGSLAAYILYRSIAKVAAGSKHYRAIASFFAAWGSVVLASAACSAELASSGTAPLSAVLPAMTGVYALIGIGEGLATVAVLSLVDRVGGNLFYTKTASLNTRNNTQEAKA